MFLLTAVHIFKVYSYTLVVGTYICKKNFDVLELAAF